MINQFIISLDKTTRGAIYNTFGILMYCAMLVLFVWEIKLRQVKKRDIARFLLTYILAFALSPSIYNVIRVMTGNILPHCNLGLSYLPFVVIVSFLAWSCKLHVNTALSIGIPMYIAGRGVCIIGCIFTGCCYGSYSEWGVFSHHVGYTTIPCPLLDSFLSILVVFLLIKYTKMNKSQRDGMVTAVGMIAFGIIRYIIDLLRDNDKILNVITFEGIFGFIYICIGLIMLYKFKSIQLAHPTRT